MKTIRAFVGPNGGGKTLAAVASMVAPALAAGRPVWSNLNIDHPDAHVLESWRQLDTIRGAVLLLDEITSVFPSRQHQSMPPQVARLLNQLRKVDVEVAWTAPHWQRCDVILREVTQLVTVCSGSFPSRFVATPDGWLRDADGKRVRWESPWPSYKLFRWQTYDAIAFEDLTLGQIDKLKPMGSRWYYRPRHRDQWLYSTLEKVGLLDHLDEYGTCVICGGNRRRPPCECGTGGGRTARQRREAPGSATQSEDLVRSRNTVDPVGR